VEVSGFDGYFSGAGQQVTFITSLPNLPCGEQAEQNKWPSLFKFREGSTRMSDLTFEIVELEPCDAWRIIDCCTDRRDLGAVVMVTGQPIDESFSCANSLRDVANSSVSRVEFVGPVGRVVDNHLYIAGENTLVDPDCVGRWKPLGGTHTVTSSSFVNALSGLGHAIADGTLTVGGSPAAGNFFDGVGLGTRGFDDSNSTVEISHNDIRALAWGVLPVQGTQFDRAGHAFPAPSRYLISHNAIHAPNPADGIALQDFGPVVGAGKTLKAVVSHNTIFLDNTSFGGIVGLGAQDVLVENNIIKGTGVAGIYLGFGFPATGWTILGNNVQGVTAESPLFGGLAAPILLGPLASNNTVVGGSTKTNVLDRGTDNILTGVNVREATGLGGDISEAMKAKLELLKMF
jgi:hypothetical protein